MAYNNLGALYFRQRNYAKAAAVLEQGLKVNPGMVYLTKHRIGHLIKKEIAYLRTKIA